MKKLLLLLLTVLVVGKASAQSFESQYGDTSIGTYNYFAGGSELKVYNMLRITNGYSSRKLEWRFVSATPLPAGWTASGFCDNVVCYPWATVTTGTWKLTDSIRGTYSDMHLLLDNVNTNNGSVTVTIEVRDPQIANSNKLYTFIAAKSPQSVSNVRSNDDNIKVYPNPARESVNVVFESDNIKTIGVFNLLGQPVSMFHVMGNSANLPLGDAPEGVYFLRMYDAQGKIVATRRFTRQ